PQSQSFRGRYSHVAALMNGNILLVAGGYSGYPMGDLVAYKVPIFVSQVLVQNVSADWSDPRVPVVGTGPGRRAQVKGHGGVRGLAQLAERDPCGAG
ncbi:hypothetical protein chiPu_0028317, partial [Chiloscyllium punctatum]|nr:hypothetical protein [Chiloscyllium punctatum]